MIISTIPVSNCTPQTIVIGRRGTYDTIQIAFDLSYLIESYGSGTAVLAVKRSQDTSAYPAVVIQEDNTLTWTVSETDTYYVGSGECQLMWYVDGGLAKTIIYPMVVMRDILSTAEEPPDGYENWIEHLTGLGAETQQNAQNAAQSASEAEQAKDDAVNAKEASEEAARKAAAASVHAPIIQNGFWYIWNDDQYVNTNVRAEGEKGDKGDTGEKGDTGNGIESITKTGTSGLVDTYTVTYTDGTSTTFTVTNGAKGDKGDTGATGNGIASIAKTGTSGNVDTYTITYTNGQTVTFTVTNGAVSSVAGKTGAVVLDSGDIGYDSTETYTSGTAGAALNYLSRQLSDVESDFDSITEQTENIQNKSTGFYSYNDNTGIIGPTTATTSYGMSDYIPCNGNTAYTVTQFDFTPAIRPRVMFLDASNTVVGYMTGTTPGSSVFTSPATAVKMACWFYAGAGVVLGDNPRIQILGGSFTNPEYIKPVTAEDIFARKAINDLEEKVDALDYLSDSDIYTEIGANVFDPAKAITGYDISDTSPYFSAAANCVITPPINVEGQSNVTIRSANYSRYRRWIVFSTSQELDGQYVVGVSNQFLTNLTSTLTDYVIDVPAGAKYMFADLKRANGGDDWINDTIAYGKEGTSDPYSEFFAGMYSHDHESLFKVKPPSILDNYLSAKVTEDFTPYTTGASNSLTSRDIYDRCNLLFFTDNHVNENTASLQNVRDAIEYINNAKFHVDALVNAGDAFDYYGEKATAKAVFKQFADAAQNSKYPVLFAKGNHDLNDWANPPAKAFDDADWSEIWYDYAETEWGIVRQTKANGNKSTWNYFDIPSQKVRIVCVDCQDTDKSKTNSSGNVLYSGANSFYISNEQMNWIASAALNFDDKDEKGWGVIIVMHQYERYSTSNTPAYESAIQKLHDLCVAFNTQSTYSNRYTFATDEWFNLDITADFTRYATETSKPHMICFLFGHEHYDNNDVKDGINRIWTANQSCASAYADNRVNRIAGTTTQNLFDLISIDTKTRKIRFVRFGSGKNCFGVGGNRFIPDGLSY